MTVFLVVLGAAVGGPMRYLTDRFVQSRHSSLLPWGTLTVNVFGSFVLGLVTGLPAGPTVLAAVGTGFCGALTTYSTFSYETLRLVQRRASLLALANVLISVIAGLGAAAAGVALGQWVGLG